MAKIKETELINYKKAWDVLIENINTCNQLEPEGIYKRILEIASYIEKHDKKGWKTLHNKLMYLQSYYQINKYEGENEAVSNVLRYMRELEYGGTAW